ncbi:MAG: hypothetical protein NTV34_11310 [Proteobacteria bacterium]|nr:hypothetical protein [Pseudomonadota bacterium]
MNFIKGLILSGVILAAPIAGTLGCKTVNQTDAKSLGRSEAPIGSLMGRVLTCSVSIFEAEISEGSVNFSGDYRMYVTGDRGLLYWKTMAGIEHTVEADCALETNTPITVCQTIRNLDNPSQDYVWRYRIDLSQSVAGEISGRDRSTKGSEGLFRSLGPMQDCQVESGK